MIRSDLRGLWIGGAIVAGAFALVEVAALGQQEDRTGAGVVPSPRPAPERRDGPDDEGRVPPWARLGGSAAPADVSRVPPEVRARAELALALERDPERLAAWARELATVDERTYLVFLMETWRRNEKVRHALWRGWLEWEPASRAEERLLPFATSDLWYPRLDACVFLADRATWQGSLPALLRLMDLPHPASNEAALSVVLALARRTPATPADVGAFVAHHGAAREALTRGCYARALAAFAAAGSTPALVYLRSVHATTADPEERASLLEPVLQGDSPERAHRELLDLLRDASPRGRALWPAAVRALPRFGGTMLDLPALLALLDTTPWQREAPSGVLLGAVLETAATLGRRPRLETREDLQRWWERVREPLERWGERVATLQASGPGAIDALDQLLEVRLDAVDAAIRAAAASSPEPALRAAAALALARRLDHRGAPAALEALARADADTRSQVVSALRTLARGEPVPTADARAALEWWRARFPGDFPAER